MTPFMALEDFVDLKLGHYDKDGIEIVDVEGEIDISTAPRLRELLIDLVSNTSYQLVVNFDKVGFLDSTGLGVLVGGLKRVRAHDGSLDLVCTQQPIDTTNPIDDVPPINGVLQFFTTGNDSLLERLQREFSGVLDEADKFKHAHLARVVRGTG